MSAVKGKPILRRRPRVRCTRCGDPAVARGLCSYHYAKVRRSLHLTGRFVNSYVPNTATVMHIAALRAAGLGWPRISELSGVHRMTLDHLLEPGRTHIERRIQDSVLEVAIPALPHGPELAPGAKIPITGTRRRLRALAAAGFPQDYLLERLGLKPGACALSKVYTGATHCTARRARAIHALYDDLKFRRGPSERARRDARRKGWHLPFVWSDAWIDDPYALPDPNWARMSARKAAARAARDANLAAMMADYRAVGRTEEDVAAALGIQLESLRRRLSRGGIVGVAS